MSLADSLGAGAGTSSEQTPDAGPRPRAQLTSGAGLGVDPEPFAGRTAVVTGAAGGIGAATARMLAARGATVVIGDVDPRAAEVVSEIEGAGGRALSVRCDVTDEESRKVVDKLNAIATDMRDKPLEDVVIESITVEQL